MCCMKYLSWPWSLTRTSKRPLMFICYLHSLLLHLSGFLQPSIPTLRRTVRLCFCRKNKNKKLCCYRYVYIAIYRTEIEKLALNIEPQQVQLCPWTPALILARGSSHIALPWTQIWQEGLNKACDRMVVLSWNRPTQRNLYCGLTGVWKLYGNHCEPSWESQNVMDIGFGTSKVWSYFETQTLPTTELNASTRVPTRSSLGTPGISRYALIPIRTKIEDFLKTAGSESGQKRTKCLTS